MAKFTIPTPEQAADILGSAINATDRARVEGLALSAAISADLAQSERTQIALLKFKHGASANSAQADKIKAAQAAGEMYNNRAKALSRQAKMGAAQIGKVVSGKPERPSKDANPTKISITLDAEAIATGTRIAVMQGGRQIGDAEVDAKGVATVRLAKTATAPAHRPFTMATLKTSADKSMPADDILIAVARGPDGAVLGQVGFDKATAIKPKAQVKIDLRRPTRRPDAK